MEKDLVWNNSRFSEPKSERIHETLSVSLFRISAEFPNSPAVVWNGQTYTFSDLACRAAGLAQEIDEQAKTSGPVALVQSIGFDAIAAWFASSLAGRAFLLLEPDHPPTRLYELIKRAKCPLVLVDFTTAPSLIIFSDLNLLISEGRTSRSNFNCGLSSEEPAMIFPTSGSTGNPKLITYASTTIQAKVQSSIQLMQVSEGSRVLITGSHGNYGFLHHALVFLFSGGTICLADIKKGGFEAIIQEIKTNGVRHLRFTPSVFRKFAKLPQALDALSMVKAIRFSGEPLLSNDLKLAHSVLKSDCLIQNVYGSTESALFIWSNKEDKAPEIEPTVPIGRIYPLASYAIRPLQDFQQDNSTGELLIRSAFHALGDLKDRDIDKERFPCSQEIKKERIYTTGDIVRKLPDGSLIHLGRTGRMVKIRGNRVFLTEVENHLRSIPGVTGVAVVEGQEEGNSGLYGFITTDGSAISNTNCRAWLSERLPEFMIPRFIQTIDEIPLLLGGKVDYKALLAKITFENQGSSSKNFENKEYILLTQVWDSVLRPGAHKENGDFLMLGGDSLTLMILSVEINRVLGKNFSFERFIAKSTLPNLAKLLDIEMPASFEAMNEEEIQIRLFCRSVLPSLGTALLMPGIGGLAPAQLFKQATFFEDHDFWIAEYPCTDGTMLDHNRWWNAAIQIVEKIKAGIIPPPRIVFGYSFSGGLAWLVGRLLAGTPLCPDFVVIVDGIPLHRLNGLENESVKNALVPINHSKSPAILHIRRPLLAGYDISLGNIDSWKAEDNINNQIELPTVNHHELGKWNLLLLAKDGVAKFLSEPNTSFSWKLSKSAPPYFGVNVFGAINGDLSSLKRILYEFVKKSDSLNYFYLTCLFVAVSKNNLDNASKLLFLNGIKNYPFEKKSTYKTAVYTTRRLNRNPEFLIADKLPGFYPLSILFIENSLAKAQHETIYSKSNFIKHLVMFYDVSVSFIKCQVAKIKQG